jgi:hypothetical protein
MKIYKIYFIFVVIIYSFISFLSISYAQTITRGPYLQNASPTNVTVVWRTALSDTTTNTVHFGTSQGNLSSNVVSATTTISCGNNCDALQHEAIL